MWACSWTSHAWSWSMWVLPAISVSYSSPPCPLSHSSSAWYHALLLGTLRTAINGCGWSVRFPRMVTQPRGSALAQRLRQLLVQVDGRADRLLPVTHVQALVLRVRVGGRILHADQQRRHSAQLLRER